jgi:hypothetical protein
MIMKTLGLKELSAQEAAEISGGGWCTNFANRVAYSAGVVAGFIYHGLIHATLLVTGNHEQCSVK